MAVTITPTANTALDTDLILSGTVAISGALADNSETLNVSIYYNNNGATYIGIPQVYNGTSTVTYNYPNGTVLTVNYSTGTWTYQRLTTEIGSTEYEYVITFDFKGSSTVSSAVTVTPTKNITITEFSANTLDDLDAKATGTLDVTITDVTSQKIKIDVTVDGVEMLGTAQSITSGTGSYTFIYSDGSTMVVDLGNKTWEYTRKTSSVGDGSSNAYSINLTIGNEKSLAYVNSFVGVAPTINKFSTNLAYDTDAKITGVLQGENIVGGSAKIDVTHNNVEMAGTTKTLTANSQVTWTFADASTLTVDTATWTWEYNRVQSDCEDLRVDDYEFNIEITSRYGTDSVTASVSTAIPSANILGFSAEGVTDTEPTINGVLKYTLPTVANSPTMQVDVTVNGTQYVGIPINLQTATEIEFTYGDTSKFEVDTDNGTFTFTRSRDDVEIVANDSYTFRCSIIVNGQRTEQSLTVKTYSSVRNYDYQPAYPVQFYAGSPEAENTAWAKYIEEIKRIYRLYNENMNYYESMTKDVFKRIDELEKLVSASSGANSVGVILPFIGEVDDIPKGWVLCDGENGTPDLRNLFLMGWNGETVGEAKEAGLPNITGAWGDWIGYQYPQSNFTNNAFYTDSATAQRASQDTGYYGNLNMYFDASRSNAIYGRSDTVQPPAYTVYYIMKVADE